jgi:hypothetical protein
LAIFQASHLTLHHISPSLTRLLRIGQLLHPALTPRTDLALPICRVPVQRSRFPRAPLLIRRPAPSSVPFLSSRAVPLINRGGNPLRRRGRRREREKCAHRPVRVRCPKILNPTQPVQACLCVPCGRWSSLGIIWFRPTCHMVRSRCHTKPNRPSACNLMYRTRARPVRLLISKTV